MAALLFGLVFGLILASRAAIQIPWFLTGLVGNLVGRIYQGGGWKRLRIRTS